MGKRGGSTSEKGGKRGEKRGKEERTRRRGRGEGGREKSMGTLANDNEFKISR